MLEFVPQTHMLLYTAPGVRAVTGFLVVVAAYWLSLWRLIKANRGNRVIECGSITLMLSFFVLLLTKIANLPEWLLPSLGILLLLLCLVTMFFVLSRAVQAIRQRKSSTPTASDSSGDRELEYEPRSVREKWLLRVVYWGTILLVGFILWEHVKAR